MLNFFFSLDFYENLIEKIMVLGVIFIINIHFCKIINIFNFNEML